MKLAYPAASVFIMSMLLATACANASPPRSQCRVCNVAVKIGMARSEVEKIIAASMGTESHYSPYANNLTGGTVAYEDGGWILSVTYLQGTPAPRVINAQGVGEHYPPQEETVEKYTIVKAARRAKPE